MALPSFIKINSGSKGYESHNAPEPLKKGKVTYQLKPLRETSTPQPTTPATLKPLTHTLKEAPIAQPTIQPIARRGFNRVEQEMEKDNTPLPVIIATQPTVKPIQTTGKFGMTKLSPKTDAPTVGVGKANQVMVQPRAYSAADAFAGSVADSMSLGIVKGTINKLTSNTGDMTDGNHPLASVAGNLVGSAIPYGKISKLSSPLISKISNPILRGIGRVAEGSATMAGLGAIGGVANGESKDEIIKQAKTNALFGGAIGTLGELPGAIKGIKEIKANKLKNLVDEVKPIKIPPNAPTVNLKPIEQNIPLNTNNVLGKGLGVKNVLPSGENMGKSRFIENSVKNSEIAPQIMKDTINSQPYIKVNNQDTWNKALKAVEDNHQSSLNEFFNSKELKSADESALGQALIVKAIKEGRVNDANELSINLAEKYSKAGQIIQSASIFKRISPEGMLQYANTVVNRINKVFEKEGLAKPKVKLTESEATKILEGMKEVKSMADGDAKNIKMAQVMQIINDKQPPSLVNQIRALRNISLLGNAKTNVRNVVGNTIMTATDNASNVIGTPLDKLISLKTKKRAVSMPSIKAGTKGFLKGGKDAVQDSFGGLKLSELKGKTFKEKVKLVSDGFANPISRDLNTNGKFETGNTLAFKNKPMRIAENLVGTALKVGDNTFKTAAYDDVLNQLMKSNNVKVATTEMKAIAEQIAKERTYQDINAFTKMGMGVKNLPQKLNNGIARDATQAFVDSQLPYVKTPMNILKRAVEYTPVGAVDGALKINKLLRVGAKTGKYDMALQRAGVDRISRGVVGTGIGALGAIGAKRGLLTGSKAKDYDMAQFDAQNGKQPYSFKIGDKYYNYDFAQPISMPLSAGVQMVKGKKGQPITNTRDAIANALTFYSEQPMLQSMQKLLGSQYDSKSLGQRVVDAGLTVPNQFVPTALKQITQMNDKNVRSNYSPDGLQKSTFNPIKSKIPGLSKTLPKKIDTMGNEVLQYQGKNNFFNVALNPGNLTTKKSNDAIKMVEDIYNKTGNTIQVPRIAGNNFNYTDSVTKKTTPIELTSKEVQDLQWYIGQRTAKEYDRIAKQYNKYNNDSDDANKQAAELQKVLTEIYKEGKKRVLSNRGLYEAKK
jgi:hypothetical protein